MSRFAFAAVFLLAACSEPDKYHPRMDAGEDGGSSVKGDDGSAMSAADRGSPPRDSGAPSSTADAAASAAADAPPSPTDVRGDAPAAAPDGPRDVPSAPRADAPAQPVEAGTPGKLVNGKSCARTDDCQSRNCVEGVCCDGTCQGKCASCLMTNTGKPDGTCAPVRAGADPQNDCAADGTNPCGLDGQCDGAGGCRYASAQTACMTESCVNGMYTAQPHCDGTGACVSPAPVSCGNFPCEGMQCRKTCSGAGDCLAGFYCAGNTCAPKKTDGAGCGGASECSSGNCVDGVCCNAACSGKCTSCLMTYTGSPDGQCKPVKAGIAHANDCTASDPSTCGLDGKCDGAGACRKYVSGTVCKGESCSGGQYTPAGTCNGSGGCGAGAPISCGTFLCDASGTKCRTTCSSSGDCATTAYCAGTSCAPKRTDGSVCSADVECSSTSCGGRCCPVGMPCVCTQPSSKNSLKNPGFDKDLSSWTIEAGASWDAGDYEACSFSGAARVPFKGYGSINIAQCVSVNASTTYNFSAAIYYSGCQVTFFSQPGCTGQESSAVYYASGEPDWRSPQTMSVNSGTGVSAKVACYGASANGFDGFVDHVYLSVPPADY